jgi:hypothetical protein
VAEASRQRMKRLRLVEHNSKTVLLIDFTHATATEIEAELGAIQRYITSQPLKSVRTLTDWTDAEITKSVLTSIKKVAARDQPYVIRGAIVASARSHESVKALEMFSARSFAMFETRDQALDWLTQDEQGE